MLPGWYHINKQINNFIMNPFVKTTTTDFQEVLAKLSAQGLTVETFEAMPSMYKTIMTFSGIPLKISKSEKGSIYLETGVPKVSCSFGSTLYKESQTWGPQVVGETAHFDLAVMQPNQYTEEQYDQLAKFLGTSADKIIAAHKRRITSEEVILRAIQLSPEF